MDYQEAADHVRQMASLEPVFTLQENVDYVKVDLGPVRILQEGIDYVRVNLGIHSMT